MKVLLAFLCMLSIGISSARAFDQHTLERLLALARQSNPEAQYHVGMLFNNGIGGAEKDTKLAFEWFQKSALGNHPLGAYKLGCYLAGQFPGTVAINMEQAVHYKLVAAEAGYALAQHDVANSYFQKGNFAEAEKWWKRSADQGFAAAANNLSVWYGKGSGTASNPSMSYAYFKLAQLMLKQTMNSAAQVHLDQIAAKMSPTERQEAEQYVYAWRAQPSELTLQANNAVARIDALLLLR